VAVAVLLLTIGIWRGGIIKYEMFPTMDADQLTATVVFPEGTPLQVSVDAVEHIRESFQRVAARHPSKTGDSIIINTFAMKGASIPDRDFGRVGPQYGAVRAELVDATDRTVHSKDLTVKWEEEIGKIPGAISLSIVGMQTGPPGASLEIWVQGEDMNQILPASEKVLERLRELDGLYQLRSDYRPGKRELRFRLKPEARSLGLTVADLARQVRAGYYGEEAMRIQRGRDDIRVKVRYTADERRDLAELDDVRIRTLQGFDVPLRSVADVTFADGYSTIIRTNGFRRVAILTEVDADVANTQEIIAELNANFFEGLLKEFPGISIAIEGSQKENAQALASLWVGFPLALLGIFVIIATIFRSYVQPFVIMATVPFGIIGAVYGHLIMGFVKGGRYDLTMMSLFGIVALAGVVVNDAIVLIECVNNLIADGVPFFEAIKRGGARRFRAIFLTTVSTVGGLMPMIVERDMQAQFLVPMAVSIAAGVAFATLLTLLLIPSLLGVVNDLRRLIHYAKHRRWPTREEVEPAIDRKVDVFAEESKRPTPVVPVAK
jgi:multidrug efflux pump subunit AcrB